MKEKTLITGIALLIIAALLLAANMTSRAQAQAQTNNTRFVSKWTQIPPNTTITFMPRFATRPLELNVWVALAFKENQGPDGVPVVAVPYSELNGLIHVSQVTSDEIKIYNSSDMDIFVQVVARP